MAIGGTEGGVLSLVGSTPHCVGGLPRSAGLVRGWPMSCARRASRSAAALDT
jgi:hypothetical protein